MSEMRQAALDRVAKTFVRTSECHEAEESFDKLMSLGPLAGGLCLLICGESGVGKSTLVRWLTRNLKTFRDEAGWSRSVVCIQIPTSPTAIGIFEALLAALGDPKPSRGTRSMKKRRLVKMLRDQGVKLIVLDDLQHVVDRTSDRVIFDASEAIKEILIDCPVSVLCAGLADAERVVGSNEQLTRRHMSTVYLPRFDWQCKKSKHSFIGVLKAFESSLKGYDLPELLNESVALRFYLATGGIMDFVFKLFLFAAQIALEKKLSAIGPGVFAEAWKMAFLHSAKFENPFLGNVDVEQSVKDRIERAKRINLPPCMTLARSTGAKDRLRKVGL